MKKAFYLIFIVGVTFTLFPLIAQAISLGERDSFYINSKYDLQEREDILATLQRIGESAYFYIDDEWWSELDETERTTVKESLRVLDQEFHYKIYPTLTSVFGLERRPGIDKDVKITILIHPMNDKASGYFDSKDEYPKLQVTNSNEKEMLYLNSDYINIAYVKSLLAHEFVHLITFNQKEHTRGIEEEVWLNEVRAEIAPTLVGYNDTYRGSYLQTRVSKFLEYPSNPLTEWTGDEKDYAVLSLFAHYVVDHYGAEIFGDSLKSQEVGISSLNKALKNNGFEEDFSQVFTDWTVAILVNDCSLGEKYCYKNENLQNVRVAPSINFLPLKGTSTFGTAQTSKNWSGKWFKIIGGDGTLNIEFIGNPDSVFKVPYVVKDSEDEYSLGYFQLTTEQRGDISISGFGSEIASVIIIPTVQTKTTGFTNPEKSFSFFWSASITKEDEKNDQNSNSSLLDKPISGMSKAEILAKISEIERLLNQLRAQLSQFGNPGPSEVSCQEFTQNLSFGLRNNSRVRCLQEFLKFQGSEIYPEGIVSGNFFSLTKTAVIRFQEKYSQDILVPWGLSEGTGYVGKTTREKINELLGT
ncbi:peptidoglycan-binding domain-containing protein [Patescibacteria group bacterium]